MCTIKKLSVYKDLPNLIKLRAINKYDGIIPHVFTAEGETLALDDTLKDYDGLNYTIDDVYYDEAVIDFSNTTLPWEFDYNSSLLNTKFVLKNFTNSYDITKLKDSYSIIGSNVSVFNSCMGNYAIYGTPTISEDGIASGFSSVNSLALNKMMPSTGIIKGIFRLTTASSWSSNQAFFAENYEIDRCFYIQNSSNHFAFYDGTARVGTTDVEKDTTYWIGFTFNNDTLLFNMYLIKDNDNTYTIDTLPEFNEWSQEVADTTLDENVFAGIYWLIGKNLKTNLYWQGSIDLNNCKIYQDDVLYWEAGELAYQKVAYGFTKSSYIATELTLPSTTGILEFRATITTGSDISSIQDIYDLDGGYYWNIAIANNTFRLWSYSQGSYYGTTTLEYFTTYDVKVVVDTTTNYATLYMRKHGSEEWIEDISSTYMGDYFTNKQVAIGRQYAKIEPYLGDIWMDAMEVYYNNELIWADNKLVPDTSLTVLGCIDSDYEDDGSEHTFNCFVGPYTPASIDGTIGSDNTLDYRIILSDKEKFIWSKSSSQYQECRYLGTVSIPKHNI
jgi:hypothetical protein